ncbi:radical SAM family heme chaperone HemW [Neptuniibacter caesariensis]|uniref:Heme chaperone HemW n=1 Tax=Neptuniibacter caesariensis TaxID=207954 RepID=A0A7U8CAI7_NEPCE|nr:radical SAM family heme chaperone HemW [Neptuniibacter caesariensis]EAR62871.1 coproporphyrinogen III oxidase [Oceanospirillum sp. MED92] [Neptuniibacter caesariensis]
MSLQLPPLSLYIHVPWCIRKCPYCDFNSHAQRGELPEQAYIECLLEDLRSELHFAQGRTIQSIFIGGGTPSLFQADSFKRLLLGINAIIPIERDAEITLEANPGTFEQEKFIGYKDAGINRLSIGIQSFNNNHLQALGRIHSSDEAVRAATLAREIFPRLNLDLMHGLPSQSETDAIADLQQAIDLDPDHLSWYQLTIEPNTEFYSKSPSLPVDETLWGIQEQGQQLLADHLLAQYEISAYAKGEQFKSRHNLNYWSFGDYIGIGAGAHGKITLPDEDRIIRRWKQKQPKAYMQSTTRLTGDQPITREERAFEFMMNALRLYHGVPVELFAERTGLPLTDVSALLDNARGKGLLEKGTDRLAPTQHGRLFLNDLLSLFLH